MRHSISLAIALLIALFVPALASACSSCGCTLSADWDSQGYAVNPGLRLDLRYDYLDQSQLRSGTGTVARADVPVPPNREFEQGTVNRYLTLGLDYSPSKDWGINLQLPTIDRSHTTIAANDADISSSNTRSLGDVRVIGRYQGFSEDGNIGIQFGLKLPTGAYRDNFRSGPQTGNPIDRGLQAGSGTTDLLIGIFHFGAVDRDWDYFAQGLIQKAANSREDYRTGTSLNVNAGLRYMAFEQFIPQVQVNAKTAGKDSGSQADSENSGGTVIYLSPGAGVSLSDKLNAYAFVQLPLYQRVNGWQLAPRYTVSVGLRYSM